MEEAAIRELREETRLKIPEKVLRGSIKGNETFDHPERSSRGRTITTAFVFKLDDSEVLPRVRSSDDAKNARWVSFGDFKQMRRVMYEDHYHIITKMLSYKRFLTPDSLFCLKKHAATVYEYVEM